MTKDGGVLNGTTETLAKIPVLQKHRAVIVSQSAQPSDYTKVYRTVAVLHDHISTRLPSVSMVLRYLHFTSALHPSRRHACNCSHRARCADFYSTSSIPCAEQHENQDTYSESQH